MIRRIKQYLTIDEIYERDILIGFSKSRIRWMSQDEQDRLRHLNKVHLTNCRKVCANNFMHDDRSCAYHGCYMNPHTND